MAERGLIRRGLDAAQSLNPSGWSLELPTLTREVEIPVYVVHNSPDAEDYFFLFDFERFMERSKRGWFVRPKLKIWAGRSDFNRRRFARQFREVFATEFEKMRADLRRRSSWGVGWLDFGSDILAPISLVTSLVVNIVLLAALAPGSAKRQLRRETKLEDQIDEMQGRVEDALSRIEIALHIELYAHAYRARPRGSLAGLDYEAWPLPGYVAEHLYDRSSGSWW